MSKETAPRFAGIGGHHSHRSGTVEWLTPPAIIAALGPFDLDPCAAIAQPWPTAAFSYTPHDNGLRIGWDWESLKHQIGPCTCRTNSAICTQTPGSSEKTWSKTIDEMSRSGCGDALDAARPSLWTDRTSAEKASDIGVVGASDAYATTPEFVPPRIGESTQRRLGHPSEPMPSQNGGRSTSAPGPRSTTTRAGNDIAGSLFNGEHQTGGERASSLETDAPIATEKDSSPRTILYPSAIHNSQERFEGTSSPRASPAIHQSATLTHSSGSRTASASTVLCPSCRLSALGQTRGQPRVFLNPPYSNGVIESWLARLAEHGRGTALIFARTETEAFFRQVWNRASALLFMEGRINFHVGEPYTDARTGKRYEIGDRAPGNAGAPTVLCAYGADDADVLAACRIAGHFVPLRVPRSVVLSLFAASNEGEKRDTTWRLALAEFFSGRSGPVGLDELYRHFAGHRKAAANPNYDAKLRQQLQLGPYRRVGRGAWEAA